MLTRTRRSPLALLVVASAAALAGCPPHPPRDAHASPRPAVMPSYGDLAARYNAHLAPLDRLWSRASVTARWKDSRGRRRSEDGDDSKLLWQRPDRLSLSVGKLGQTFFRIGTDGARYWAFNLLGDEKIAYVGTQARLGMPDTQPLPIPINPLDLPVLLGLVPIDLAVAGEGLEIGWSETGAYVLELPAGNARVFLDPTTALPVRVQLLGPDGRPVVESVLSQHAPVPLEGGRSDGPRVATRAEVRLVREDASITLRLRDMTDARGPDEDEKDAAFAKVFDLDYLLRTNKPDVVVDLDRPASAARR